MANGGAARHERQPASGEIGKRTLVEQVGGGIGVVQRKPEPHGAASGGGWPRVTPPKAGINKAGFIDHGDGSNIRTGPAESGGQLVRDTPLPPATRVFVSGSHPDAPAWWYVTAYLEQAMVRGYVQNFRVNTDLPEPLAELRQLVGGETPEGLAKEKFSGAVTDGHDLRYYENVLLYVNHGRAGITGSYQDPGLRGGGANNIQLLAGHRIWLVSAQYAKALQDVVPSGSLTGGAVAKAKRFVGHLEDILHSVTRSPDYFGEVAGEYAQAIRDHLPEIVGIVAGFIMAEATSAFLAVVPTGVTQIAATVIQLGLAAFGAAGAIQAGAEALVHANAWLTTAWTAKGKNDHIAAASKEFLKMLVSIAMAALSALEARTNYGNALKIASSMPIGGLPAFAVAGGGQFGGDAATAVAIGPGTGSLGAAGNAMMQADEESGGHGQDTKEPPSDVPPRKQFKTSSGQEVEIVEQGRSIVPTGKVERYLRGKVKQFTREMNDELRALKRERQTARKQFDADPEKARRLKALEDLRHNSERSNEMAASLERAGLPDSPRVNDAILHHLLEIGEHINEANRVRYASELATSTGRVKLLSTWTLLPDGRVFLSTLQVIPK